MPNYNATATLLADSGATEDVWVNGFAVSTASPLAGSSQTAWAVAIKDFYDDILALQGLRSRDQFGHSVKIYATDTGVPNYPIYESTFSLVSTPGTIDLPAEVNLAVSYANDSETSIPRARRRGRIYIGGWSESVNGTGIPTSATYTGLATAYKTYCDTINGVADLTAGVWSRSNATVYAVERVWCDNEWDTMRSRGGKSTARSTQTVS